MKIQSFELQDFRSHAAAAFALPRVSVLAGPVGSGKTSVLLALAALLCGRNQLTDGRGVGLDEQGRLGTTGFALAGDIVLNGTGAARRIQRVKKGKDHTLLAIPEAKPGTKEQQAALLAAIGAREETLLALLDIRPFLARTQTEQKAEILAVIQPADAAIAVPADKAALLKTYLSVERIDSLGHIEQLYARAFELRRQAKKERDTLIRPERPAAAPGEYPAAGDVQADLAVFGKELAELNRAHSSVSANIQTYEELERWAESPAPTPPEAMGEPELEQEAVIPPATVLVFIEQLELAQGRQATDDCDARVDKLTAAIGKAQAEVAHLAGERAAIEGIASDDNASCPTCHRKLPVKTRERLLSELGTRIAARRDELEALNSNLEHAKVALADWQVSIQALEQQQRDIEAQNRANQQAYERGRGDMERQARQSRENYELAVRIHARAVAAYDAAVKVADERQYQLRQLAAPIEQHRIRLPGLEGEIATLNARITKATEVLARVLELDHANQAFAGAQERWRGLERRCADLEVLVEWLGPKGLPATLFDEWSGPFLDAMGRALTPFNIGPLLIDADEARFRFLLSIEGSGVPAAMLSEGEQLIFEWAYRSALAETTGVNLVCLDAASRLGAGDVLHQLAAAIAGSPHQVLLTLTTEQSSHAETIANVVHGRLFWFQTEEGVSVVTGAALEAR